MSLRECFSGGAVKTLHSVAFSTHCEMSYTRDSYNTNIFPHVPEVITEGVATTLLRRKAQKEGWQSDRGETISIVLASLLDFCLISVNVTLLRDYFNVYVRPHASSNLPLLKVWVAAKRSAWPKKINQNFAHSIGYKFTLLFNNFLFFFFF